MYIAGMHGKIQLVTNPRQLLTRSPISEPMEAEALRMTLTISPKSPSSWFGVAATSQMALRKTRFGKSQKYNFLNTFGGRHGRSQLQEFERCALQGHRRRSVGDPGSAPQTGDEMTILQKRKRRAS